MGCGVSPTPRPPLPPQRTDAQCTGGWVGSRAGLDMCGKPHPHRVSILDRPAHSQSLYRLSYQAHNIYIYIYMHLPLVGQYVNQKLEETSKYTIDVNWVASFPPFCRGTGNPYGSSFKEPRVGYIKSVPEPVPCLHKPADNWKQVRTKNTIWRSVISYLEQAVR